MNHDQLFFGDLADGDAFECINWPKVRGTKTGDSYFDDEHGVARIIASTGALVRRVEAKEAP